MARFSPICRLPPPNHNNTGPKQQQAFKPEKYPSSYSNLTDLSRTITGEVAPCSKLTYLFSNHHGEKHGVDYIVYKILRTMCVPSRDRPEEHPKARKTSQQPS